VDLKYLDFGDLFEEKFLKQGYEENRPLQETLSVGWDILSVLPEGELTKVREGYIKKYYQKRAEAAVAELR